MADSLPKSISSPLQTGTDLDLRFHFHRVWTRPPGGDDRAFGLYWSEADELGQLHPQPTPDELRVFYDTASYDEYMGKAAENGGESGSRGALLDRVLSRVAGFVDGSDPLDPGKIHDDRVSPSSQLHWASGVRHHAEATLFLRMKTGGSLNLQVVGQHCQWSTFDLSLLHSFLIHVEFPLHLIVAERLPRKVQGHASTGVHLPAAAVAFPSPVLAAHIRPREWW